MAKKKKWSKGERHKDFNDLLDIVGAELATEIVKKFGGTNIYIPTQRILYARSRDEKIREESAAGVSKRILARKYGVGTTHIWRIIKMGELE